MAIFYLVLDYGLNNCNIFAYEISIMHVKLLKQLTICILLSVDYSVTFTVHLLHLRFLLALCFGGIGHCS